MSKSKAKSPKILTKNEEKILTEVYNQLMGDELFTEDDAQEVVLDVLRELGYGRYEITYKELSFRKVG